MGVDLVDDAVLQGLLGSHEVVAVGIGDVSATVKMPVTMSATVIVLGDKSASIKNESETSLTLDENGVAWN